MHNVETVRAAIITRLERYSARSRDYAKRGLVLPEIDKRLLFDALADAGEFNAEHPECAIPPLDPLTCKVSEPRFADTDPADRWRTA